MFALNLLDMIPNVYDVNHMDTRNGHADQHEFDLVLRTAWLTVWSNSTILSTSIACLSA